MSTEITTEQYPGATDAPVETAELSGTYTIDPVHSQLGFAVKHMGAARFRSHFREVEGALVAEEGRISLAGRVPVESIAIDSPAQFRGHVLSPDFFDAEAHPEISFQSTSVELFRGEATIRGNLMIKGKTVEIEATGSYSGPFDNGNGEVLALSVETVIDRRSVGLDWQSILPGNRLMVDWNVTLEISLEMHRAGEQA